MSDTTALLLAQFGGGVLGVYMMAVLWEFFVFKRIMDDPVKGKLASVIAGYLTAATIAGLALAGDGPFRFGGFLTYLFGAAVVGFFGVRRGLRLRDRLDREGVLEETFS